MSLEIIYDGEGPYTISEIVLPWQIQTLHSICRSYIYYTSTSEIPNQHLEVSIHNCIIQFRSMLISSFIMDWCKVFGVNNNEIHWKKLFTECRTPGGSLVCNRDRYENKVRRVICDTAEVSMDVFNETHHAMRDTRNYFIAHVCPDDIPEIPSISTAYTIASAYNSFIMKTTGIDVEIPSFEFYEELFEDEVRVFLDTRIRI